MDISLDEIVSTIRHTPFPRKPMLIGIDGFGGSGKTTIANKLKDMLGSAHVVNIDDFIVKEKVNESSWGKGGFDRERLARHVLIPASKGLPVSYEKLLWESNTLSEPIHVPTVDYLIVEGISSCHPGISQYYDYKIWVDTPIEIAKSRGKARDVGNENESKWDLWAENDLKYQAHYHPERQANFKIRN